MDLGKAFTYMFEDKDWIAKLAIGGVILLGGAILSFLVIPAIAALILLLGYTLVVIKNVYDGNATPLPEWNNIGDLFMKGLMAVVGVLIWSIPAIVLACCIGLVNVAIGGGARDTGSDGFRAFGGLVVACLSCLSFIVGIAIAFFVYAPLTRFALTNELSVFWDFQGTWKFIQANTGNYVIAFLLAIVANIIASFGIIACVIGVFFTTFWAYLVVGHLYGQVARSHTAPTDSTMMPPPPTIDQPPSMMQGPMDPAPSA